MDSLEEFLEHLLGEGRMVFRGRPVETTAPGLAIARLGRAYESYRLEVAGPLIGFDAETAFAASALVRNASWALVDHRDRPEQLAPRISMGGPPTRVEHHLSADLLLRYLPQLHRRARALNPGDPLAELIAGVLRRWPLSGVLAGLSEPPLAPLDFGGHDGLAMLYAERWTRQGTPAWKPEGRILEYADLVAERGAGHG